MSNERELFEAKIKPVLENIAVSDKKYQYALNSIMTAYDTARASTTMQDDIKKDAERYRWLCENKNIPWSIFLFQSDLIELGIDGAIDKARE